MPVLGLILNLAKPVAESCTAVTAALAQREDVELGALQNSRLPAVLEVPVGEDVEDRVRGLSDLAGLLTIDVVYAHFEDALEPHLGDSSARNCEETKCP